MGFASIRLERFPIGSVSIRDSAGGRHAETPRATPRDEGTQPTFRRRQDPLPDNQSRWSGSRGAARISDRECFAKHRVAPHIHTGAAGDRALSLPSLSWKPTITRREWSPVGLLGWSEGSATSSCSDSRTPSSSLEGPKCHASLSVLEAPSLMHKWWRGSLKGELSPVPDCLL